MWTGWREMKREVVGGHMHRVWKKPEFKYENKHASTVCMQKTHAIQLIR